MRDVGACFYKVYPLKRIQIDECWLFLQEIKKYSIRKKGCDSNTSHILFIQLMNPNSWGKKWFKLGLRIQNCCIWILKYLIPAQSCITSSVWSFVSVTSEQRQFFKEIHFPLGPLDGIIQKLTAQKLVPAWDLKFSPYL